jgi:D-amino-acid dehydrogenase
MRIAVIGAGIVGVTTAYELAHDGHEVSVFERRGSVAAEGSFANAGVLAPGYVTPWAAPGMPGKLIGHWLSRHAPLRFGGRLGPGGSAWLWQWWRSCKTDTYRRNRMRMHRLAQAGRTRRHVLGQQLALEHEYALGYTVLLRRPRDLAQVQPGLKVLTELGVKFNLLDPEGCRAIEPGLSESTPLHAGIHVADDEVANCRQFAHLMRQEAQKLGARFLFHTEVLGIEPGRHPLLRYHQQAPRDPLREAMAARSQADALHRDEVAAEPPQNGPGAEAFDAVVVCAALDSRQLLAPHGLKLPLMAVHGYSITAPMRHDEAHPECGPRSGVMDERYKVSISRFGTRLRVAGSAELGGKLADHNAAALKTLHQVLHDWYPGVAQMAQAQVWKGARPMLPDGPPVIGASGIAGVWLNLGHGSSGWALANGSARLLADLVGGSAPSIDPEGLGVERLLR